jgi:DNA-binding CsgD family transcriptional regulator
MSGEDAPASDRLTGLSPRERDCLRLVLENRSSKQIARELGLRHSSVDTHIARARAKLGVRDRHEAARLLASWETGQPSLNRSVSASEAKQPSLLPALSSLNYGQQLLMVALCALAAACVFGAVLSVVALLQAARLG